MTTQTTVANFDIERLTPIFNFVLNKVKHEDREDVKAEAVLRILTAIDKGEVKDVFTFSHTVVQRTVYDYYRKSNRKISQNSTSVNFCDGVDEDLQGNTADCFSAMVEEVGYGLSDVRTDYLNNISEFTMQQRRIVDFMLFTEEGMGMGTMPAQIAEHLGLNKSHASRAMAKLKEVCQG